MTTSHPPSASTRSLRRALAERIVQLVHEEGLEVGARLNENRLAEQLGVSRTPVRAALDHLAQQGFVARKPGVGVTLLAIPPLPPSPPASAQDDDEWLLRVARDRAQGRLPDYVSEMELMQTYGLGRPALRQMLERLSDLGMVERKLGYGWRFQSDPWDAAARHESYRFRMVIEPAAIREPGFQLASAWVLNMRERHEFFLRSPWGPLSSVAFFEMNAAFHEGVAEASGNRFLLAAVQRQNRLRRLSNYDWKHGPERVAVNCREHLEMLARMEAGDQELAALLMLRHLEVASRLRAMAPIE